MTKWQIHVNTFWSFHYKDTCVSKLWLFSIENFLKLIVTESVNEWCVVSSLITQSGIMTPVYYQIQRLSRAVSWYPSITRYRDYPERYDYSGVLPDTERYHDARVFPNTKVVQSDIMIPVYYQIQRLSRARYREISWYPCITRYRAISWYSCITRYRRLRFTVTSEPRLMV